MISLSLFFYLCVGVCVQKEDKPENVQPIASSTLVHSDLTSVYGTVVMNRTVLFLGTGDGQLLKVGVLCLLQGWRLTGIRVVLFHVSLRLFLLLLLGYRQHYTNCFVNSSVTPRHGPKEISRNLCVLTSLAVQQSTSHLVPLAHVQLSSLPPS